MTEDESTFTAIFIGICAGQAAGTQAAPLTGSALDIAGAVLALLIAGAILGLLIFAGYRATHWAIGKASAD